jgi:leucyl aminopeptidase (aminopeptidase T)
MLSDILKACLGIKKSEGVLVVTDHNKIQVAREIEAACKALSEEVVLMVMRPRSRHGEEPPEAVARAMLGSDVVIMPTTTSLTHTNARKKACEAGARVASMPGVTPEMLKQGGLHANYREMRRLTERVAKLGTRAETIKITSRLGCDFTASIKGRKMLADTGYLHKKGSFGNLPAGEAFIAPLEGSAQGKLVFDGSFSSLGVLEEPLELVVEEGKVVGCSNETLAGMIRRYRNADNIAEIGLGTNRAARLIGNVLEDEKVYGTCHVAIGDNHTFGGETRAEVHLDGVIKNPTVLLDGEEVMKNGKFMEPFRRSG